MIEKQHLFLVCVSKLITWADSQGYQLTGGELYRTPEQAQLNAQKGTGIANSNHGLRLAIDLNLFVGGTFQTTTEQYRPLGEYWESLNPLCAWGGRFSKPDADHFSFEHNGVR